MPSSTSSLTTIDTRPIPKAHGKPGPTRSAAHFQPKSLKSHANTMAPGSHALTYNKFMLYEMKNRFYVIASNSLETRHRITRIDRTSQDELTIVEDETLYSGKRMGELLRTLDDGNKAQGGLGKPRSFHGVAGKSLRATYMLIFVLNFIRLHSFYCRMVYDSHYRMSTSRPFGRTSSVSLRKHGYAPCLFQ